MEEKVVESGWSESLSARAGTDEILTNTEYQFPENLPVETLRKHLVSRKIITEVQTCDKEYLITLFRKHLLPLPQRINDLQRLNTDVKAISLNQFSTNCKLQSSQRKRKMESDDEAMLSGGSNVNIEDSRTVASTNLTVRMPGGKSDRSSKPVKLKRKSFDVNKQKLEKSARLDEKDVVFSEMMPEIILPSAVSAVSSSTKESSNCYQEGKHKRNTTHVSPLTKLPESNHEVKENFRGSKRKVTLPSREEDADAGCSTDGDFQKTTSNPVVEVFTIHAEDDSDKTCLNSKETIHVSFGGGSRRSTLLPKRFDSSEHSKVLEKKTKYDGESKDLNDADERISVKDDVDKSKNFEKHQSKDQTYGKRGGTPERYRRESNRSQRQRSPSRDRNERNHNSRNRSERNRRSPVRRSGDYRNGPDFRRGGGGNRWVDRGRRIGWQGRSRGFSRGDTRRQYLERSGDRPRERTREKSREKYRKDRGGSGDEMKSEKVKKDRLSKERKEEMKKEIKHLERMIEIKTKKKKDKSSESDGIQVVEKNGSEIFDDVESSTINVAIHCCNQNTTERHQVLDDQENVHTDSSAQVIEDDHVQSPPRDDNQPENDKRPEEKVSQKESQNDNANTMVESCVVNRDDTNSRQQEAIDEKNDKQNKNVSGNSVDGHAIEPLQNKERRDKVSDETSSDDDDDDDDENSSSSESEASESSDTSHKKKKKRKKKKKNRKRKNESDSSESSSDESESDRKKKKKKKRKKSKTKKSKRKKKTKAKDGLFLLKSQLAEWMEKTKDKIRDELIANIQLANQQKSDGGDADNPKLEESPMEEKPSIEKTGNHVAEETGNNHIASKQTSAECVDTEIDESLLTDDHGYLTGIPLRKEAEDSSERKDSGETTPHVQIDEVFDLFKSDDDLDYDLSADEEENWKRKSREAVEQGDSSADRRDGKRKEKERRGSSEKYSERKEHRRDYDKERTHHRSSRESKRSSENKDIRTEKNETRDLNNKPSRYSPRMDQVSSSQIKFTASFNEENTKLKEADSTKADGITIAKKVRDEVYKRNDFWKGDRSSTTGGGGGGAAAVADVFNTIGSQGVEDESTGHWNALYSGIQSKLLQIAGNEGKLGARGSVESVEENNVSTTADSHEKQAWFINQDESRKSVDKYEHSSLSRDESLKRPSHSSKRSYENDKEESRLTYPSNVAVHSKGGGEAGKYHDQNRRESFDRNDRKTTASGRHRSDDTKSYDRGGNERKLSNRWDQERNNKYDERYKPRLTSRTDTTSSNKYNDKRQRTDRRRYSPDYSNRRRLSSGDKRDVSSKSRFNKDSLNFRYSHDSKKLPIPHLDMDSSTEARSSPSSVSNYTRPEKNYRGSKVK